MKQTLALLMMTLALALSGCTSSTSKIQPDNSIEKEDPTILAIKNGTDRIHNELVKLAKYQQQKNHSNISKAQLYEPPKSGPMSEPVTLTWTGPIDKILAMLAKMADYEFPTPLGTPHFRDIIVKVDVVDTPIFKVIEDIGWQAGDKTAVILDMDRKVLRLAYQGG